MSKAGCCTSKVGYMYFCRLSGETLIKCKQQHDSFDIFSCDGQLQASTTIIIALFQWQHKCDFFPHFDTNFSYIHRFVLMPEDVWTFKETVLLDFSICTPQMISSKCLCIHKVITMWNVGKGCLNLKRDSVFWFWCLGST